MKGSPDAVVEEESARLEQLVGDMEVLFQLFEADVLDHANAGQLVVAGGAAGKITVVLQFDGAGVCSSRLVDAVRGKAGLLMAEGDAAALHLVVLDGVQQKSSPAAANVKKLLAGLEAELAANEVELCRLSGVKTLLRVAEVGATVDHGGTEPGQEELGRLVIVKRDGGTVTAA